MIPGNDTTGQLRRWSSEQGWRVLPSSPSGVSMDESAVSNGSVKLEVGENSFKQCKCRFTWEVIKRNKAGHAIILTTHSMEEADLLCDSIAIMAEGRLAAVGTSMDLKQRFGVGYRLTVVKDREGDETNSTVAGGDAGEERCAFGTGLLPQDDRKNLYDDHIYLYMMCCRNR
jgi:hypothetical protein